MALKVRALDELAEGERFFIPGTGQSGTLERLSPAGATVEYDGGKSKVFTAASGAAVSFTQKERVMISRKTQVVKLVRRGER